MTATLETRALAKSYGGVRAVRGVDFSLAAGRVHALLGENGAGKSTFVGMLSGIVQPDSGDILVRGEMTEIRSAVEAQRLGIRTVHQELELAGPLSVSENILLGALPKRWGHVNRRAQRKGAEEVLQRLGAHLDVNAKVDDLSVADRQIVEIARAIAADPQVLFLDEPTAALAAPEIESFLAVVDSLRRHGVAILYISHRLDEVLRIADDITVLRDGMVALATKNEGIDKDTLVTAMLGSHLAAAPRGDGAAASGTPAVVAEGLAVPGRLEDLSFTVSPGEIVGFFGMPGSGHDAVASALFGDVPATARSIRIKDSSVLPRSPREAIAVGLGLVPADRKGEGLALGLPVEQNLLMSAGSAVSRLGLRRRRAESALVHKLVGRYGIKTASPAAAVSSLSGGNQQKVVLGKVTATSATDVLILCEPTRGVDVGAKLEIYQFLRSFARDGGACILVSSDSEETEAICDRAYVIRRGALAGAWRRGEFTSSTLVAVAL